MASPPDPPPRGLRINFRCVSSESTIAVEKGNPIPEFRGSLKFLADMIGGQAQTEISLETRSRNAFQYFEVGRVYEIEFYEKDEPAKGG